MLRLYGKNLEPGYLGIATGCVMDGRASVPDRGKKLFLFSTAFRPALGVTHPPIQWVSEDISLRVKQPERETSEFRTFSVLIIIVLLSSDNLLASDTKHKTKYCPNF
jgi:hypothetical protein